MNNLAWTTALLVGIPFVAVPQTAMGLFEGHGDVGTVLQAGAAGFDAQRGIYTVSASGENMWATADAFHFVWKKMTGDVSLTADIAFATAGGNAHKKGMLIVRQSLDADAAYCDAALHGNGLVSLQCRERQGGITYEIQQAAVGAKRLRLEKRGASFLVAGAVVGESPRFTGGSVRLPMEGAFYVGIGVCAHDKDAVEQVAFSNVTLGTPTMEQPALQSTLEVAPVRGDRRAIHVSGERIEAPSFAADGKSILFLAKGKMQSIPLTGGTPQATGAGMTNRPVASVSQIRLMAAKRRGKLNIYSQASTGGRKTWLTNGVGNNMNPEYTPDGTAILFDSDRTGTRQVWRMSAGGLHAEQLTSDALHNWLPHLSPDGTRVAMLSSETAPSEAGQEISVRVLTLAGKTIAVLAKITGGRGTMEAPSWSPDNRLLTFVSYQMLPQN